MKKNNHFQKQLKFHCQRCQTIYQLMEVHSQVSYNCTNDCLTKWQAICHERYWKTSKNIEEYCLEFAKEKGVKVNNKPPTEIRKTTITARD